MNSFGPVLRTANQTSKLHHLDNQLGFGHKYFGRTSYSNQKKVGTGQKIIGQIDQLEQLKLDDVHHQQTIFQLSNLNSYPKRLKIKL